MTFTLLPAVDVADGRAVRLVQGDAGTETAYGDPRDAALAWQAGGAEWIHLVDLDAAFGRGSNADAARSRDRGAGRQGGAVGRHPRRRLAGAGAFHRLRAGQPRHGGAGGPGMVRTGDRRARRARRGQPRRARRRGSGRLGAAPARRPWRDRRRRRPVGDPRAAGQGRLRPLRRHRREQGRHAARPQRGALPGGRPAPPRPR